MISDKPPKDIPKAFYFNVDNVRVYWLRISNMSPFTRILGLWTYPKYGSMSLKYRRSWENPNTAIKYFIIKLAPTTESTAMLLCWHVPFKYISIKQGDCEWQEGWGSLETLFQNRIQALQRCQLWNLLLWVHHPRLYSRYLVCYETGMVRFQNFQRQWIWSLRTSWKWRS